MTQLNQFIINLLHCITHLRAAQKNPAESSGSSSLGVEEPNANAGRGAERAARWRSSRSERSRSRCSNASRRDIEASHIARLRSSTCRRKHRITYDKIILVVRQLGWLKVGLFEITISLYYGLFLSFLNRLTDTAYAHNFVMKDQFTHFGACVCSVILTYISILTFEYSH